MADTGRGSASVGRASREGVGQEELRACGEVCTQGWRAGSGSARHRTVSGICGKGLGTNPTLVSLPSTHQSQCCGVTFSSVAMTEFLRVGGRDCKTPEKTQTRNPQEGSVLLYPKISNFQHLSILCCTGFQKPLRGESHLASLPRPCCLPLTNELFQESSATPGISG